MIVLVFGCAYSPNMLPIQEKVIQYDDVDAFVNWLEDLPNISDVNVNKTLFLTSHPPKVDVTIFNKDVRQKLL